MQIITGKTGTTHVQAEDDRALHAATFGTDMYVLDVGSKFAIAASTTNSLTLSDGELMLQGCHARIRHGENETLLFTNGKTGENRIDLVVAKYKKVSGIESIELVVYEGDRTTGTPTPKEYKKGNILEGAEEVDMPLYKITLTDLKVTITPLFTVVTGLDDVYRKNEVYTKTETYNKNEVYTKGQVDNFKAKFVPAASYVSFTGNGYYTATTNIAPPSGVSENTHLPLMFYKTRFNGNESNWIQGPIVMDTTGDSVNSSSCTWNNGIVCCEANMNGGSGTTVEILFGVLFIQYN